jgi:hypothetical protein
MAADLVEDVGRMGCNEQAELEHGELPQGPAPW